MNSEGRRMVAALERRRDHLKERLDSWDTAASDPGYTHGELAAVRWALAVIAAADAEGVLDDLAKLGGWKPRRR